MSSAAGLLDLVRASAETDDRRTTEVLDAALDAFLDFGIRRTSMSEIARRAGISPATLYKRYPQKKELVLAASLREAGRYIDHVDQAIDTKATAQDQIVELFLAIWHGIRGHSLLNRLVSTELDSILPMLTVESSAAMALGQQYLIEFITRLQHEHKLPAYDPVPTAEFIARLVLSLILNPHTVVPDDDEPARQFGREHIVPLFRLTPNTNHTRNEDPQ